jgi:hypothetical protein
MKAKVFAADAHPLNHGLRTASMMSRGYRESPPRSNNGHRGEDGRDRVW